MATTTPQITVPTPKEDETEDQFIERCTNILIEQKPELSYVEANAMCHNKWTGAKEQTEFPKAGQPKTDRERLIAHYGEDVALKLLDLIGDDAYKLLPERGTKRINDEPFLRVTGTAKNREDGYLDLNGEIHGLKGYILEITREIAKEEINKASVANEAFKQIETLEKMIMKQQNTLESHNTFLNHLNNRISEIRDQQRQVKETIHLGRARLGDFIPKEEKNDAKGEFLR